MPIVGKFILTVGLIVIATFVGYLARRLKIVPEKLATPIMTFIAVIGYSSIDFFAIWALELKVEQFWLPVLGAVHVVILACVGLWLGRMLFKSRSEIGLFGIASSVGNNGFTMGGFVVYLLFGEAGLARVSILGLMWIPSMVFVLYPIARNYAEGQPRRSLGKLVLRSIFDWRSVGLLVALAAIALSMSDIQRPQAIADYNVIDMLIFSLVTLAYFCIGLRLHASQILTMKKAILTLAGTRFIIGGLVGGALATVIAFTRWPMDELTRDIFLIEAFVPTAVTTTAVANMFRLNPREASALFVTNTVMYLLIVLPIVLFVFG